MSVYYSAQEVREMAKRFDGDMIALALSLLPEAAKQAVVPISDFYVGAIAIDDEGNFYLGANQEDSMASMAQTVHAEQSALSHAWSRGAKRIAHMVVNYTPCGHCRQFMNELRGVEDLQIHLPHSRNNPLHQYLPDSFGPKDLNMAERLLDAQHHDLHLISPSDEPLVQSALQAARESYAPYSKAYAGLVLETKDGKRFVGRYAENAAYNPSLPPLQSALNVLRLSGYREQDVVAGALVCTKHGGHDWHAKALWEVAFDAPLSIHFCTTTQEQPS